MAIDLEHGDPERAERIATAGVESRPRTRGSTPGTTRKTTTPRKTAAAKVEENSLVARCVTAFNDLADQAEARDDEELGELLRRRAEAMGKGMVSLTRNLTPLRKPLIVLLSLVEPTFAFWELTSLIARRYVERRQRIAYERQQAATGMEPMHDVPVA